MAARWSLPSGSVGGQRFRVWPLDSDSYNHVDLTANFDAADGIIGTPSGGSVWPPTTGLDGGIYAQIQFLINERAPIGSLWYWFRPSTSVPLSTYTSYGWVVADGSTLTAGNHSFPGVAGSVILPNLLNAFPLGASTAKTIGTAGVLPSDGHANDYLGAPGIGGVGGHNALVLGTDELPTHSHALTDPGHHHDGVIGNDDPSGRDGWSYTGGSYNARPVIDIHGNAAGHTHDAATGITMASAGNGIAMDNRPRYVGLLPIIKVKHVTSL